ncbi:MAG: alpha-2-macroglobulin family protein [Vulcanimicrobiota bacterium]
MERKPGKSRIATLLFLSAALLILAYTLYINNLDKFTHNYETIVMGSDQLDREGINSLRVIVMRHSDKRPQQGSQVKIELVYGANRKKVPLFEGRTDNNGTVDASFTLPKDFTEKDASLTVRAGTPEGVDILSQSVKLYSPMKIHLAGDKPLYKPGETIHIRSLALSGTGLTPASGKSLLEVFDSKGNKVFKKAGTLSPFGIASGDFELGREINNGTYRLRATIGQESVEKNIEVKKYVLPKYKVTVKTEKPYFSPEETLKGTVKAAYFFGKPLSGAKIWVDVSAVDAARRRIAKLTGETSSDGTFSFSMNLKDYLSAAPQNGREMLILQAAAIDKADHRETGESTAIISTDPLIITLLPEAGKLVNSVENRVYVLTTFPDGSPASAAVTVRAGNNTFNLSTGDSGFASFTVTPSQPEPFRIEASTKSGIKVEDSFRPEYAEAGSPVLHTNSALYKAGDTLEIQILSASKTAPVYIDILRGKQLLLTRTVDLQDGKGSLSIALTPDVTGLLEINAFSISPSGGFLKDTRKVYVGREHTLTVSLSQSQPVFRPGDKGRLTFTVTDEKKSPAAAALGVQIVDESVFALQEVKSGQEKICFLLGSQLLKPNNDIYSHFTQRFTDMVGSTRKPQDDEISRLAFTASAESGSYSIRLNSYSEKAQKIAAAKQRYYRLLHITVFLVFLFIYCMAPFLVFVYTVINGFLKLKNPDRYLSLERKPEGTKSLFLLVFGYIALLVLPVFIVLLVFITEHRGCGGWLARNSEYVAIGMVIADLILIFIYLFLIHRGSNLDDIRSSSTLAPTYWIIKVFMLSVSVFLVFLIGCYFLKTSPDSVTDGSETLFITLLISLFSMPVFLLISMGSHMLRPIRRSVSPAFIGMTFFTLLVLACFFLYWHKVVGKGYENAVSGRSYKYTDSGSMSAGGPVPTSAAPPPGTMQGNEEGLGARKIQQATTAEIDDSLDSMKKKETGGAAAPEQVYLRQFFPETMYVNPELITDENGKASVEITMADSITTWRTTAFASSKNGALGSGQFPLRVFQDFFIDLDLPVHLTRGDEVSVPVALYNYLGSPQKVRLELSASEGIEALDGKTREATLGPGAVSVVYFKVAARKSGFEDLTVTGYGSRMHDAIRRTVEVEPDGKEFAASDSGILKGAVTYSFSIPRESVPGSGDIQVKLYPGILSQVVEGLEKILQMPYGCFEQTSSTVYPNIMAVNYMTKTGKLNANIRTTADRYINAGYQKLLTFEVQGGGFSLYGQAPASTWLSAYGLMEFNDMKTVHDVDEQIIERTARWLEAHAAADGSYDSDLRTTAYVASAMTESGHRDSPSMKRTIEYIRKNALQQSDPYMLGLCAHALSLCSPESPDTAKILEKLAEKAVKKDGSVSWQTQGNTLCYGYGNGAAIETTSLIARAMLNTHSYPELVQGAVNFLLKAKDPNGTWHSTQATVQALKTLILSMSTSSGASDGTVEVLVGGKKCGEIKMTPDQSDVLKIVDLKKYAAPGENLITLKPEGKISGMYQIVGNYYMPWGKGEKKSEPFTVKLSYDRRELKVSDTMNAVCSLKNNQREMAPMVMVQLGIPPGFSLCDDDFEKLVSGKLIDRFEMTGHQVILYVGNLNPGQARSFSFRLTSLYPIRAKSPATRAYEYYNQEKESFAVPVEIVTH